MHRKLALAALLLGVTFDGFALPASAASVNVVVTVGSPASTGVTCAPVASFTSTAPAGAVVCPITVAPANWTGSVALSGTDASLFSIGTAPLQLQVGGAALSNTGCAAGDGQCNVTLTSTP